MAGEQVTRPTFKAWQSARRDMVETDFAGSVHEWLYSLRGMLAQVKLALRRVSRTIVDAWNLIVSEVRRLETMFALRQEAAYALPILRRPKGPIIVSVTS